MSEQAQKAPRAPTVFSTAVGTADDLDFNHPVGRTGSQYDGLISAVRQMTLGQILKISPEAGVSAQLLRNRVTAPLRKKAEPVLKERGLRLRIRVNKAGTVIVQCVEKAAPAEAGEEDEPAAE